MNLMILLSPLILSLIVIAVMFAGVLFALDMRRTSHQNHVRRLMRSFVLTNAMQSFSVITSASKGAESVAHLLASLEGQDYPKLQVIIFTDASAGSNVVTELRRMQKQMKTNVRLRIIRRKPGDDERALIKRYTNGEALVWLNESDRISKDFFTRVSIELLDESRTALAPRVAFKVDDTLRNASRALHLIARQTVTTLFNRNTLTPLIIRRVSYLNGTSNQPISDIEHSAISVMQPPTMSTNILIEGIVIISVLLVGAMSAIFLPYSWQIIPLAFAGTIVLLMEVRLLTYPYSAWTKLTLALMIPLWPIVAITLAGGVAARRVLDTLWKQRTRPLRMLGLWKKRTR